MTSRHITMLLCILGSAVMLAASAEASGKKPVHVSKVHVGKVHVGLTDATVASAGVPCRRSDLFMCGPITYGNLYLGDDPDPFIRAMIQRDPTAKFGGSK